MEFTVGSSVRFGWETFKKRPWFFIVAFLIVGVLSNAVQIHTNDTTIFSPGIIVLLMIAGVISFVVQMLLRMGRNQLVLRALHGVDELTLRDMWAPSPIWKFLGAYLLVAIIVIVGFILLIIPGVYLALRYMFVSLIIMDTKMKPFEALRESARITDGHKWDLLLFVLALAGLNILGFLCFVAGLLVSIPVTSLAFVHAYRTLSKDASHKKAP